MIHIDNIKKTNKGIVIYDGLNLDIPDKSRYLIVCKNGEGKTTLTKLIKKAELPDKGEINLDGYNEKDITVLYDDIDKNTSMRVDEYMRFYARCYHIDTDKIDNKIDYLLNKYGLYNLKLAQYDNVDRGSRKIISLLTVIMADRDVIVFDSPFDMLGDKDKYVFMDIIDKECDDKTLIILSDAIDNFIDVSTHVAILDKGRCILQGEKNEVLREYGYRTYIEVEIDKNIEDEIDIVEDIEGIKEVTFYKNKFYITTDDINHDHEILKCILSKDICVTSFKRENKR